MNQLPSNSLFQDCAEQSRQYLQDNQSTKLPACYEVFRIAVRENSEDAWRFIFDQYQKQIERWIQFQPSYHYCDEELDDCVNAIFWKFFRSMLPEKFGRFNGNVPAILQYLKKTCVSYVLDCGRRFKKKDPWPSNSAYNDENEADQNGQERGSTVGPLPRGPETSLIEKELRQEVFRILDSTIKTEKEKIILDKIILLRMKSRDVLVSHPEHFSTVDQVYRTTENLKKRLLRDERLIQLLP